MKLDKLSSMKLGWFIGNFEPAIFKSDQFEVSYKEFKAGDSEPEHYQLKATEITLITSGTAKLGDMILQKGDILTIPPLESAGFQALSDVTLVAIKFPSVPNDKVIGRHGH
jgi:quercetin dioxygenase-like cupin family protein